MRRRPAVRLGRAEIPSDLGLHRLWFAESGSVALSLRTTGLWRFASGSTRLALILSSRLVGSGLWRFVGGSTRLAFILSSGLSVSSGSDLWRFVGGRQNTATPRSRETTGVPPTELSTLRWSLPRNTCEKSRALRVLSTSLRALMKVKPGSRRRRPPFRFRQRRMSGLAMKPFRGRHRPCRPFVHRDNHRARQRQRLVPFIHL